MFIKKHMGILCASLLLAMSNVQAAPQQAASETVVSSTSSQEQVLDALFKKAVQGKTTIELGNEATLSLPENMVFLQKNEANQLAEMSGNSVNPKRYGMIFPKEQGDKSPNWWFDLSYEESGYIKDDDAKDWKADEMLQNLKDGTEAQNKVRAEKGISAIMVKDWIEKPHYDAQTHRLIWSVDVREKSDPNGEAAVNYNTYALGRKGYINLTLITGDKTIAQDKLVAQDLLSKIEFKEGLRYTDFNPATDKVAEYGLAALVGGLAAKKLGLFAMLGVLLAKFGKLLVLALIPIWVAIKKLFSRKKDNENHDNAE